MIDQQPREPATKAIAGCVAFAETRVGKNGAAQHGLCQQRERGENDRVLNVDEWRDALAPALLLAQRVRGRGDIAKVHAAGTEIIALERQPRDHPAMAAFGERARHPLENRRELAFAVRGLLYRGDDGTR